MSEKLTNEKIAPDRHIVRNIAVLGFVLAMLSVVASLLAGPGSRLDWWNFRTGLTVLKWGGYVGVLALAVSLIGCIVTGLSGLRFGFALALIGVISSLTVVGTLWHWKERAQTLPRIHDVTTDTTNPPAFVAILPLRKSALNKAEYGGSEIAALQHAGYPDIGPETLPFSADYIFQKALATAIHMGWQIVEANRTEGRIEATDTTFWFGFKDDIVIRIVPEREGSRIDIRSVSRVGQSDVGTNATRIRKFLQNMR